MDFVIGLPQTQKGHDSIWMIVDQLTKLAHFLPICRTDPLDGLTKLYYREITKLHDIPF